MHKMFFNFLKQIKENTLRIEELELNQNASQPEEKSTRKITSLSGKVIAERRE